MSKKLIMLSSITHATKGRKILESFGVSSYIERTPINLRTASCGYSLAIYNSNDIDNIINILNKHAIPILGVTESVSI